MWRYKSSLPAYHHHEVDLPLSFTRPLSVLGLSPTSPGSKHA